MKDKKLLMIKLLNLTSSDNRRSILISKSNSTIVRLMIWIDTLIDMSRTSKDWLLTRTTSYKDLTSSLSSSDRKLLNVNILRLSLEKKIELLRLCKEKSEKEDTCNQSSLYQRAICWMRCSNITSTRLTARCQSENSETVSIFSEPRRSMLKFLMEN